MTEVHRGLFPNADPADPETRRRFTARLAEQREELAEYYEDKRAGRIGLTVHYGRGFVGQTRTLIRRLERWLALPTG